MSEWQATPPPRKVPILVTDGKVVTVTELSDWESNDSRGTLTFLHGVAFGGSEWEYDLEFKDITHWMPLPSPPTVSGEQ